MMNRREFLQLAGVSALSGVSILSGCTPVVDRTTTSSTSTSKPVGGAAHFSLRIAPVKLELSPDQIIQTIGYNEIAPGPVLRIKEGQQVTVDVTTTATFLNWSIGTVSMYRRRWTERWRRGHPWCRREAHGISFTARPSGTRWYHTHAFAGKDLRRSLYSGQFGFFHIESKNNPGQYDQEVFIRSASVESGIRQHAGFRKGPPPDNGLEVMYRAASFNDKILGHGEPIRVKTGERVLFICSMRVQQTMFTRTPGNNFNVIALDGNPVPIPRTVPVLVSAPAERIDAIVEMKQPGVWVFGSTEDSMREMGMGVVIEYAGQPGTPQWSKPPSSTGTTPSLARARRHLNLTSASTSPSKNPGWSRRL